MNNEKRKNEIRAEINKWEDELKKVGLVEEEVGRSLTQVTIVKLKDELWDIWKTENKGCIERLKALKERRA